MALTVFYYISGKAADLCLPRVFKLLICNGLPALIIHDKKILISQFICNTFRIYNSVIFYAYIRLNSFCMKGRKAECGPGPHIV